MQLALTLVSPDPDAGAAAVSILPAALAGAGARVKEPRALGPGAIDLLIEGEDIAAVRAAAEAALIGRPVDICVQPWEGRRKRLLIADMDSTIIGCECLDELADFAGVKAQVSAITERAMRGELAFEGALRERVAMLKGLPLSALQQTYDERVRLNPGARTLVRTMGAGGARCVLVSGGFTFFTGRVAKAAGFHADRANTLGEGAGALDGTVGEPILGREAKLSALQYEAAGVDAPLSATLAIGDGANDLAMIEAAGLGVAYRAKPIVAAQADAKVDHADLTALLYFQGYRAAEFVTD
ncbi:MAG: phosphoserine phosphatase SerB [Phenylobacterium sp.]|uniref:phosphoserine phosphatase SerB n=1 Tax=Phenylobacterium sp. TaxID=1871053 RepID=UPI002733F07B|nr:phosphoserine phosphatase SerB [Phenylobacterium sp.]MDP3175323.1 phosphoserine phosphatase SerB [Phenylobacterium sp.]